MSGTSALRAYVGILAAIQEVAGREGLTMNPFIYSRAASPADAVQAIASLRDRRPKFLAAERRW